MTDRTRVTERFAGLEVTEAPVSASQAEALTGLCAEVRGVHAGGQAEPGAVRAGLAVARELTDRLRAGASPGARPQSRWAAFLVRRPDGGASLVVEDGEAGEALEFRLSSSRLFTGGAWRGVGDEGSRLVAFRVTARGATRALATSDGTRQASADLGALRLPPWGEEAGDTAVGASGLGPFGAALGGLLAAGPPVAPAVPEAERPSPSSGVAGAEWSLVVTAGPGAGSRFPLVDGAVIGRAKGCGIRLGSSSVSRRHAELRRVASGWLIADLASSNGTWLNGQRITSPTALDAGDQVQLGEVVGVVEGSDADASSAGVATVLDLPVQRVAEPPPAAVCPRCGHTLAPGERVCGACGARAE